jgi:hypothetical protein
MQASILKAQEEYTLRKEKLCAPVERVSGCILLTKKIPPTRHPPAPSCRQLTAG